jgi:hypothetical protein
VKPWYKFPEGRSRLAGDRAVAALYVPKMAYGPLLGELALRGDVDFTAGSSGIVRTVRAQIQFRGDYPNQAPQAFVRRGQFEPQVATRHFRGDGSCCLWFVRAEDGWQAGDPHAFEHFLQQLLVFFDRQLAYDAVGEFPGKVWVHDRPIAQSYCEDRLERNPMLIEAFKVFRRGLGPSAGGPCPCLLGRTFAQCHQLDFVDLRQRLSGLKFDTSDPVELNQKHE